MALVTLAAAKGSPGATTTALVMGALWPRQVLVAECDSAGADIPLRMPASDGGVLDPERGLLSLAAAGRKGLQLAPRARRTRQQVIGGTRGTGRRAGSRASGRHDQRLADARSSARRHTRVRRLADCGRIGATTPQNALSAPSRLLVLVASTEPSAVVHMRERLISLSAQLDPASPVGTPIAIAVIADAKARDAVSQVRETLQRTEVPLVGVWHIAFDARGAGFFKGRLVGRADKTLLVRTAREADPTQAAALVEPFFEPLDEPDIKLEDGSTEWGDFSFASDEHSAAEEQRASDGRSPGENTLPVFPDSDGRPMIDHDLVRAAPRRRSPTVSTNSGAATR